MKCAIFCCLLAFCVLEIVLANQFTDFYNKSMKEIYDTKARNEKTFQNLMDAANKKGKDTVECQRKFKDPINKAVAAGDKAMHNCSQTDSPLALIKCGIELAKFKNQINRIGENADNCMKIFTIK